MYLLYADESGTVQDASQQYFVLAGFCVFERQCYWLSEELEKIAARFDAADTASVELHGSPMLSGKKKWRHYPKEQREQALQVTWVCNLPSCRTRQSRASHPKG